MRLESDTYSLKMSALKTLGEFGENTNRLTACYCHTYDMLTIFCLGLGGKEVMLVILPLLTDPNVFSQYINYHWILVQS